MLSPPLTREVLQRLPKAELHLHLRGALPVAVFTDLLNRQPIEDVLASIPSRHVRPFRVYGNIAPFLKPRHWSPDEVAALFQYSDFDQFLATYHFTSFFIRDTTDLRQMIAGVLESLTRQGIVYAEITVSVIEYIAHGILLEEIAECMESAAEVPGIRVQWIVDLVRNIGPERCKALLEELIAVRPSNVVGITLGGSEHEFPPTPFADVYRLAREHGFRLTVHAGEALGPQSVWDALNVLEVERIGHGVRAVEDPALVAHLAEHRIPLEVCPTSNLCTGVYPSIQAHPVRQLLEAGVPITISSDDPTFFHTTLVDELVQIQGLGISGEGILDILRNGFRYAFLPQDAIDEHLACLEQQIASIV